jgi:hypothetical protein
MNATGGNVLLSFDPALTISEFNNPSIDYVGFEFQSSYLWVASKIPLSQGTKIYLSAATLPATFQLYLDA